MGHASDLTVLRVVELVPVVELEPFKFAAEERPAPSGTGQEVPDLWYVYWLGAMADSGLDGLTPLRIGSWHVPVSGLVDPALIRRYLGVVLGDTDGIESLDDPDSEPALNGGLAFLCPERGVEIEPGCCSDLRTVAEWRAATECRDPEWRMLWNGHPWLSMRYEEPWLVLSGPHESDKPEGRWTVSQINLRSAMLAAVAELERFASRIAPILGTLGYRGDSNSMARRLAGIGDQTASR